MGKRNDRGEHNAPTKNPREKFNVESVASHIPRANREKLLINRLSVGSLCVGLEDANLDNCARRNMNGVATSSSRMKTQKELIDFNVISTNQTEGKTGEYAVDVFWIQSKQARMMNPSPCREATIPSGKPIDIDLNIFAFDEFVLSDCGKVTAVEHCIQSTIEVVVKLAAIIMAAGR
jgi:hypothetical protein